MSALRRLAIGSNLSKALSTTSIRYSTKAVVPAATRTFHKTSSNNNNAGFIQKRDDNRTQIKKQAKVMLSAPTWKAPALVNGEIKDLSSADYNGKFLVLLFYPADFTFVCPTEIIAFSDRIDEFRKLGAEVVGVSVDNVHSHLAWTNLPRKQGGLGSINIPLVSDIKRQLATSYNVLTPDRTVALRGLFVIDPKGKLRISTIHDLPIGRSVDETLRVIEAIQFTDKYGEVCPANWKSGEKAIKPDAVGSQEYFNAANE